MHRLSLRTISVPSALLFALFLAAGLAPQADASADEVPHLRLVSTSPAADTIVAESPSEIRLFFSEPPQMQGTTVRVADASEALVASTAVAADGDDPRQVYIRPVAALGAGSYTVHWRVIAQDGHTQRGSFGFRVGSE